MTTQSQSPSASRRFVSSAALVMAAFVISRVLGLARESILASVFSVSAEMDAFRVASRVPDTLYILIAGGALGSAFIPTFAGYAEHGERKTAWTLASAVINLVFLITLVASLVTALIAPWLVANVLGPGYDAQTQALSVSLLRWMLATTVIFGVSGLLMGILNANDHFLLPALAPSFYNLGIIFGAVFLVRWWGIFGVAIGTVIGALLHLLIQLPALRGLDWTYKPVLGLKLEGVQEVGRLMGPRVLGLAITQLHFWVNTNLGSRIAVDGVVSALTWGWLLMLLPQGIFAQAIAIVAFPSFSAQVARGEQKALRSAIASVLGFVLFFTLPATVGLLLLGRPLVEVLFMRRAFDARAVSMVNWALAWYTLGLIAHSGLEVVTRAFYALHDTFTPVWVGGGAMALNVLLSIALSALFSWLGPVYFPEIYQPWMPLGGLALANSVATTLETLALTWFLRRRLGGLDGRRLWHSLWRLIVGSVVMGLALLGWTWIVTGWSAWIVGLGGMLVGVIVFIACTLLLGSPEWSWLLDALRRRWKRQSKSQNS